MIEPWPVGLLLTVYKFCFAQSRISDKTNDLDTSYFYVFQDFFFFFFFFFFLSLFFCFVSLSLAEYDMPCLSKQCRSLPFLLFYLNFDLGSSLRVQCLKQ